MGPTSLKCIYGSTVCNEVRGRTFWNIGYEERTKKLLIFVERCKEETITPTISIAEKRPRFRIGVADSVTVVADSKKWKRLLSFLKKLRLS